MTDFNAKKARTKHAMPMWVDSFLRKTMTLSVEQVGAYNLILFAMWSRESCDLPDDDAQIAAVCRVSRTIWARKFKPILSPFFDVIDGCLVSDRLQKEAVFVEKYLQSQSDKKRGKKSGKPPETKGMGKTGDISADKSADDPTQQPNNPTKEVDKSTSSQEAESYQRYLDAHPNPVASDAGSALFSELVEAGTDPEEIIASAKAYAATVKDWSSEGKVQQSDNFLDPDRGQWRKHIPKSKAMATDEEVLAFHAKVVLDRKPTASIVINSSMANRLIAANLVTPQDLSKAGVTP